MVRRKKHRGGQLKRQDLQTVSKLDKRNAKTSNGMLRITTDFQENVYKAFNEKTKKFYIDTKHVQSGMLQGWNLFCLHFR